MIPQLGFSELLLIAVLAIIVVGPKDLPLMMRKFGRMVGKIKAMGAEFRDAFDEMGAQAELEDLKKEMEALKKSANLEALVDDDLSDDLARLDGELRQNNRQDDSTRNKPLRAQAPRSEQLTQQIEAKKAKLSDMESEAVEQAFEQASAAPVKPTKSAKPAKTMTAPAEGLPDKKGGSEHE